MSTAPEPLTQACVTCTRPNPEDARYCSHCGLALGGIFGGNTLVISSPPDATRGSGPLSAGSLGVASTRPPPPPSGFHGRSHDARELADPLIGVVVAERYRIREPIGRGGMGVVYRVEHARIGKLMALKLLTGELTRDPTQVARFKREAQMVSKLSHPNTVQVFDFGASDGLVYLAMEYLKGEDLGHLVRRVGPLGVERTLRIVVQICSSLAEAHDKGIVHRDLKPENIIIVAGTDGEDVVKVLDFGLAKLREAGELSEVTSRGAIVGTPYYMSPEQIRGDDVGPESDVYALGALTYACLTASVVFEAQTPMGVLSKHLTEEPASPSDRFPDLGIPPRVAEVVLSTLVKDARRRLPSVQALQRAFLDELAHEGARSVEQLLDVARFRKLAPHGEDEATRDEVENYERKLRQRGRAVWAVLAALLAAGAYFGFRTFERLRAPPAFVDRELEPNDLASNATVVPFPFSASGVLGTRLDAERSDRDFYRFDLPKSVSAVSITLSATPSMALCLLLYPSGGEEPLGRYCPGEAGRALSIPDLRLPPGGYLLAVLQDREGYTHAGPPAVAESISDRYQLAAAASSGGDGEREPNDFLRDARMVAPGSAVTGRLSWMRDVDVVCSSDPERKVTFRASEARDRPRARSAVLQVTPLTGAERDIPVRIQQLGTKLEASPRDVLGEWQSVAITPGPAEPACIELRLVPNPWAPTPHPLVAPAGDEPYRVDVVAAP